MNMGFADNLRELRKEKNVSQKMLSEKIGYAQSVVSDWENGKVYPTSDAIVKLALFFDVSADFLLGINETALYDNFYMHNFPKYNYILEKIQKLSLAQINKLIKFLEDLTRP